VVETKEISIDEAKKETKYLPVSSPQADRLFCSQVFSTRNGKKFGSTSFFSNRFSSEQDRTTHINKYLSAAKKKAVKKSIK
jgi:hypothetical protein